MPPFNRSALVFASAQEEVAGSAGDDTTQMLTRAGNSLDAVAQKWNRMRWKFLQDEQIIPLVAPITVTGCSTTEGSPIVTAGVGSFSSILVDDSATGAGLRPETLVSSTGSSAITMVASASATVTGASVTFQRVMYPLATNFKTIFDLRMVGNPKPLYYQPRRLYDREVIDQRSSSEVFGYDLYFVGGKGKIRLVPPPAGAETLNLKYYRRMLMPSQTAASGLDLPEDYEDIFIAAAKAHYLADKGQSYQSQWAFWNAYANDGLREMRRDERLVEDEDLSLQPPIPQRIYGPNSPHYWANWMA